MAQEARAPGPVEVLKPNGSIVIQARKRLGAGGAGHVSTLTTRALLAFLEAGELKLCEEFIGYNQARLPSPAQWVTVERLRVKDAYTHIWWMSPVAVRPGKQPPRTSTLQSGHARCCRDGKVQLGAAPRRGRHRQDLVQPSAPGLDSSERPRVCKYVRDRLVLRLLREEAYRAPPGEDERGDRPFFTQFLTQPGGLVFDPFAGSNTTGATAQSLKRRWVSLERDAGYLRGSRGRFL